MRISEIKATNLCHVKQLNYHQSIVYLLLK